MKDITGILLCDTICQHPSCWEIIRKHRNGIGDKKDLQDIFYTNKNEISNEGWIL